MHPEKSSSCVRGTEAFLFLIEGGNEQVMSFSSMRKATRIFCEGNLSKQNITTIIRAHHLRRNRRKFFASACVPTVEICFVLSGAKTKF